MDIDYIRPDLAGARILINPIWEELCIVLKEIQIGCRLSRIPESRLRKFYEQSKKEDFFSGFLMTAEKAPDGYGYPYRSTQIGACRLANATGFVLQRQHTAPGDYVKHLFYALTPKDDGFVYQDFLESVTRTFWNRLTDEQLDALNMKPIVEQLLKENQGKRKKSQRLPAYVRTVKRNLRYWHSRKRANEIDD